MARKKLKPDVLDMHEGVTLNQVKIILRAFGLDFDEFDKWMYGQTAPILVRHDEKGHCVTKPGFYEYDLFRWIANKRHGTPLIFD